MVLEIGCTNLVDVFGPYSYFSYTGALIDFFTPVKFL